MALPNLGTLSLRPAAVPPTGEFWSLSREEADERNKYGGVEPLTQEEYVWSQELSDGDDYFRVRYTYRNPPSFENPDAAKYLYYMFDAEQLWKYTRTQGLNPVSREQLWREDWRELRDKYAPGAPEPGFVASLPRLGATVRVHEGGRPEGRLVRMEFPSGSVLYFEGDKGEERRVRKEWDDGEVAYLKGNKGNEYLVRTERPNGKVWYHEGDKGEEHVVRIVTRSGQVQYYEGDSGKERKVRVEHTNGQVLYYKGDKGEEHKVRTEWPNGAVWYFEGGRGVERVVRVGVIKNTTV